MKNVAVLLVIVLIGSTFGLAYGQTRQEKKQMQILESEISFAKKELSELEKQLEREKKLKIYELEKKINVSKKYGDPKVAPTTEHVIFASIEQDRFNQQIDSIESLSSTSEIELVIADLEDLRLEREDMVLSLIHISEPTRRTPISYAVFCLKK